MGELGIKNAKNDQRGEGSITHTDSKQTKKIKTQEICHIETDIAPKQVEKILVGSTLQI